MAAPIVTVVMPTWQRHSLLLHRAIPSVHNQTYAGVIELIVVSDGPDPELHTLMADREDLSPPAGPRVEHYVELAEHDPVFHWGVPARLRALELARGKYVAYLDDDDQYRPRHVEVLVDALERNAQAGFAWSHMMSHGKAGVDTEIRGPLGNGGIGTPMIMHRRELLDIATWGKHSALEDWELVAAWLGAGVKHQHVEEITVDVWPSGRGVL